MAHTSSKLAKLGWCMVVLLVLQGGAASGQTTPAGALSPDTLVARGEYVLRTAGGCGCHGDETGGGDLSGGRPLRTPFGIFFGTNITPDRIHGIGAWSDADFLRAMREGRAPDGRHYFPVFPYTSFTRMTEADLLALKAYLFSRAPVARANTPHLVLAPFNMRWGVGLWKALFFQPGPLLPELTQSPDWQRGAYLTQGPGHCGECHTPRNLMGGLQQGRALAGSLDGPEFQLAPNITPDQRTGIGDWSLADLRWYLETGFKPDGDDGQGLMAEMIERGFQHLTDEDRKALGAYLFSLPPIENALLVE